MRNRRNSKTKIFREIGGNKHCWYCGEKFTKKKQPTIDHIYPRWKYGKNADILENYAICCKKCNGEKGGLDPLEWLKSKNMLNDELLVKTNDALKAIYER